mgnify:CR=1 FL=1
MGIYLKIVITTFVVLFGSSTFAQMLEEVIVTGVRASGTELPGVVYKRKADFLLLEIRVMNDSRSEEIRKSEIVKTLKSAISVVKKEKDIQLSIVKDGFVLPLASVDLSFDIGSGQRPDTSEVTIRVKTEISDASENPEILLRKLNKFADSVPVEGRTELVAYGEAEVSVVNPNQYRSNIIALVADDVKKTTSAMGPEYRVLMSGLDAPVKWVRAGPVHLAMYIPYSYQIIPDNISSYFNTGEY